MTPVLKVQDLGKRWGNNRDGSPAFASAPKAPERAATANIPEQRSKSLRRTTASKLPICWTLRIGSTLERRCSKGCSVSMVTKAGSCTPSCASAGSPADGAAGLSNTGSAYTYTASASHTGAARLGHMCHQAIGNSKFWHRHGLRRGCQRQCKGKRD